MQGQRGRAVLLLPLRLRQAMAIGNFFFLPLSRFSLFSTEKRRSPFFSPLAGGNRAALAGDVLFS